MANDFASDTHCIALYKFESGAFGTDSKGNDDGLSQSSTPPAQDATDFDEGSQSVLFSADSYMYRTDTNLSTGFPLKSGTSNKTISVCMRVKMNVDLGTNGLYRLWGKTQPTGNKRTMGAKLQENGGTGDVRIEFQLGDTGGNLSETVIHLSDIAASIWVHMTFVYRDSDKFYAIYLRDHTTGATLGSDVTGTATNNIALFAESDFMLATLGSNTSSDTNLLAGNVDEVAVFDDVITATEAGDIASQTYVPGNGGPPPPDTFVKVEIRAAP